MLDDATMHKGIFHTLLVNIANLLLLMAKSFRLTKALRNAKRLKEQRDAKKKKDKMTLMLQADKSIEACIEVLFL